MAGRRLVWSEWIAVALPIAAVLLLFLPAVARPNHLLYPTFSPHSDLTVIHWPKANLMHETWRMSRQLPLWTPDNLSGMPLAANQLAMLFYPPAWLFLVLPPEPVFNVLFVFHLLWSALGMFLLLRQAYDLDLFPAVIGAMAFAFSGKCLAHMAGGHASLIAALAWLPWAFLGLRLLLRTGRGRWGLLTALALAMQVTTHSLIAMYTVYLLAGFAGAWAIRKLWQRDTAAVVHALPGLVVVPILAACLGAVQILPLAELAEYSNRSLSLSESSAYALTPLQLLAGLLLPTAAPGHEYIIYLGLIPLLLVGLGVQRGKPESWFWIVLLVGAVLFSLGPATPLFRLAYRWLPGMQWVRTPARVFFLAALCVSILAAMGAQRLARSPIPWSNPLAVAVGGFCLALGIGLAAMGAQVTRATVGLALLPALGLLLVGLCAGRRVSASLAQAGLALLLTADLLTFGVSLRHFVSPAAAFGDGAEEAQVLAAQPGLFRTYSPSYSVPSHVAAQAGLQTADGVEPVHLSVYDRFMRMAGGYGTLSPESAGFSVTIPVFPPDSSLDQGLRDAQPDLELLGLLNVGYLVSAFPQDSQGLQLLAQTREGYVYTNSRVLPRGWLVPWDADFILPITYASGRSWFDRLHELARLGTKTGLPDPVPTAYGPNALAFTTEVTQPALLVFSELWYPGWEATVDGQAATVEPVAGLLRGVKLPSGPHVVELAYRPTSVVSGARVSLTAVIVILAALVVPTIRSRRTIKRKSSNEAACMF